VHGTLPPEQVRAALVGRLDPSRMPDRVVPLDTVPLTANGKPDRAAAKRLVDAAAAEAAEAAETAAAAAATAELHRTRQTLTASPRSSHEPVAV